MFSLTPFQKNALIGCPNQGIFWEILEKNLTGICVTLSNGSILISESCRDPFAVILGELCPKSAVEASDILTNREWPRLFCAPK